MKKLLITLTAVLALGTALAQGSLKIWTPFGDQTLEWLQSEVDAFSAAFGVTVEIVKLDLGELKQQMLLAAPQGEAGDVVVGVPHDQIGELAAGGVLADMGQYATQAYLDDLNPQARLGYTFGGKLFGLPMFVEGPALIVNTDLVPEIPATYEDMIAKAKELTTADQFGFLFDVNNFYFAYNWIRSGGGYVFGRDDTGTQLPEDVGLASEGAIKGAEMLKALRQSEALIPAGMNYDVANGQFIDGALAMTYNGPWAISQYRDAGLNVAVVPVPPMADGTPFAGFMGVQGVLMNEFSTNKTDAANLAKWLTRKDAQVGLANISGRIPASQSALAEVNSDPIIAGFGAALTNAEPMPNIPEMGQVWGPMGNALLVITESADSDVAGTLGQAVSEIQGGAQ
jgi:arabinogalactan oligomer / maltooligosaccharide transport system substrate-binding protein